MSKLDPFGILGISSDSEMSVIKAAYRMKLGLLKPDSDELDDGTQLSELEWAYSELSDAKKRNEYRAIWVKKNAMIFEYMEARADESEVNLEYEGKSDVWSVLLSTGLFLFMIGAIGYGLYLVGAVRTNEEYGGDYRPAINKSEASAALEISIVATDIPEISFMHTATVEALKMTATDEALIMYSDSLTSTNYARTLPTATPTMVLVRACPNAISVNVRTGPSTAYSVLGQLLQGDCIIISGRNEDNSWLVITESTRPSMNEGWVSSELMDMEGLGDYLKVIYLD